MCVKFYAIFPFYSFNINYCPSFVFPFKQTLSHNQGRIFSFKLNYDFAFILCLILVSSYPYKRSKHDYNTYQNPV